MNFSIIPDAKHQELNISFNFDLQYQDKMIINAIVDNSPYQLQLNFNPDCDFQDIKSALLSKQFKIMSRSPEILKLKVAFMTFEFKNIEKLTLNSLKQAIKELKDKNQEQTVKNTLLENGMKEMRKQFDLMTTKMADLRLENQERIKKFQEGKLLELEKKLREQEEQGLLKLEERLMKFYQQKITNLEGARRKFEKDLAIKIQELKNSEQQRKLVKNKLLQEVNYRVQIENRHKVIERRIYLIEEKLKKEAGFKEIQPIINNAILQNSKQYRFSQKNKHNQITIKYNNTRATWNGHGKGLALVDGPVVQKSNSIRFIIQSINSYVGVGLAINKVLAGNQYQVKNKNQIGHGCFIVFNDGQSFSHSHKAFNNAKTNLTFSSKDVIEVRVNNDELIFINESAKKEFRMKISLTQEEQAQVYFCVYLYDNSVSIMN